MAHVAAPSGSLRPRFDPTSARTSVREQRHFAPSVFAKRGNEVLVCCKSVARNAVRTPAGFPSVDAQDTAAVIHTAGSIIVLYAQQHKVSRGFVIVGPVFVFFMPLC